MKYELQHNLGTDDARRCNDTLGASLSLDPKSLAAGCTIELNDKAADWLRSRYAGLMIPAGKVKGVPDAPEVKGVKS